MNIEQFHLISDKALRNDKIRKACKHVFFDGLTPYQAEREFDCPPGTVHRAVNIVKKHFDHCIAVASAK